MEFLTLLLIWTRLKAVFPNYSGTEDRKLLRTQLAMFEISWEQNTFLMGQGSYQDYFMFFCNFILLQSSYVFERLERHTAFLSRRYFERRERSINQVFDASILDCNHMLSSRQIFLRPNPPQFWNQRWRPNTKMCTRAPKIGPHCRSNLF